jgi:hypothetical protein
VNEINNDNNPLTNALFICNEKFLDASINAGGVKFCTDEFLCLIKTAFHVIEFPVSYDISIRQKISRKFNLSAYNDYNVSKYKASLKTVLNENSITHVFLNLTNTATFAEIIKSISPSIKVILCSHGNESGDYLHEIVMHEKYKRLKKKSAIYNLGTMLFKEATVRKNIDVVLTVSDVEEGIEKWLGAKSVFMIPRFIEKQHGIYNPVQGKVGFISDLSHEPNFFGIVEVCKAVSLLAHQNINIILVGGGKERGESLQKQYSFVQHLGYLSEEKLAQEISSWTFALNPVFYYSRGVSTKLGKSLGMGYPVITTDIGMRGYKWTEGKLPECKTAQEMATLIIELSNVKNAWEHYKSEVVKIQASSPSYKQMMMEIKNYL